VPASKKPKLEKLCLNCGSKFLSNNIRQLYCSGNCNVYYNRQKDIEKHRKYAADQQRKKSADKKASDAKRKRELRIKRQYGISQEQFLLLKEKQNSLCAICGAKPEILVIDHCHTTGDIRGLLCHGCNRGIGLLKDNIDILNKAVHYLGNENRSVRGWVSHDTK